MLASAWGATRIQAQEMPDDSIQALAPVTVKAFAQEQNRSTAALSELVPVAGPRTSLVADFNAITGVRMEERSPGSYRINIRGSSLRSPFGVRNVKIYWNDIPLTDPGGGSYFNQLAYNNFTGIQVFKGPASSMYGAGTGGLILIRNQPTGNDFARLEFTGGSFGMQQLLLTAGSSGKKLASKLSYARQKMTGYRRHSALHKDNISWTGRAMLSPTQELEASVLYTDMYYQTPGALNVEQYQSDPRSARPASGSFPSAADARAAIDQRNFTAGITYRQDFHRGWTNQTTLYGAYNQVLNPAIRNYETRYEPHYGGRTLLRHIHRTGTEDSLVWTAGGEWQQGDYRIRVQGNKAGHPDTLQTYDRVKSNGYSLFTQAVYVDGTGWTYAAGLSFNRSRIGFTRLSELPIRRQPFVFGNELAPRFSVSRRWKRDWVLLATVARGYAPPAIAELLPSTGRINTSLRAEKGWNYELTANRRLWQYLQLEGTVYHFNLRHALVQRRDESGADYFANAGRIRQTGAEFSSSYFFNPGWLPLLQTGYLRLGYTWSHFRYQDYINDSGDFSGNTLPGVPARAVTAVLDLQLDPGWYINLNYYGASKLWLNEANTAETAPYHLLGLKLGYKARWGPCQLDLNLGADNLLNETYSLGNDINAVAGRYYNAAPLRNYFAGLAISWYR
ncbi:hypothetical protein GCM10027051_00370 [Niabella terrae]